jgi:hypothetical protein
MFIATIAVALAQGQDQSQGVIYFPLLSGPNIPDLFPEATDVHRP